MTIEAKAPPSLVMPAEDAAILEYCRETSNPQTGRDESKKPRRALVYRPDQTNNAWRQSPSTTQLRELFGHLGGRRPAQSKVPADYSEIQAARRSARNGGSDPTPPTIPDAESVPNR